MPSPTPTPRPRQVPDRRLLAVGMVAGAAAGAWVAGRMKATATATATAGFPGGKAPSMIDWEQARSLAVTMNRGAALTAPERAELDARYRELVARCVPLVAAYTGDDLPEGPARTHAFDRVDWINANIDGFRRMFEPLEALNPLLSGKPGASGGLVLAGVNRTVVSGELGLLLGYLARRVLGQYDLALLGKEPVTAGKLYFVEPNIRAVEEQLGLPEADFRMWLALHETTHAFEFEAHPWLREHFNGLLEQYFALLRGDAEHLRHAGLKGLGVFVDRVRSADHGGGSWLESVMSPPQRELFAEMQATMCVVEGYSNHVMNAVGKELLPTYATIARKFEQRQRQRSASEQLFARLTGLSVKLEQYRLGEAFVNAVAAERGHATARRIWEGPEFLPSMEEIREPQRWLARIDARDAVRSGRLGEGAVI
jgi:coenzyme F420 biosynthesis associated uncharacterized protein